MHHHRTLCFTFALAAPVAALGACGGTTIGALGGAGGSTDSSAGAGPGSGSPAATGAGSPAATGASSGSGNPSCADPADQGLPAAECTPTAAECSSSLSVCLATKDNDGATTFGLRMSQLTLTAPAALTTGIIQGILQNGVLPNRPKCFLTGIATFSWLLQFDTAAGTLTTGGAKPVNTPTGSYAFVNETLNGTLLAPATVKAPLDMGCGFTSPPIDVAIPAFLDAGGNSALVLPLSHLTFHDATLSSDHSCIGSFNTAGLQKSTKCAGNSTTHSFNDGGQLDAFISLEAADQVVIVQLMRSLCVLLGGSMSGDGGSPDKCTRDGNGKIVFQGDWCAATNQAAANGCADAVRFKGSFAASGVTIK